MNDAARHNTQPLAMMVSSEHMFIAYDITRILTVAVVIIIKNNK